MKLLYRMSEWHALAKLRMHTDASLELMEEYTRELGVLLRQFRQLTCSQFSTVELPRETDAHVRQKKHPTIGSDTRFSDTSVSQSPMTSANTASQHRDLNSTERQVPANGK